MTQNYKPAYPREFRQQMVELVALGKCPSNYPRNLVATTRRYKPGVEQQVYQLIKADRGQFPARVLCETLGVSRSGYYDWAKRTPSRSDLVTAQRISSHAMA